MKRISPFRSNTRPRRYGRPLTLVGVFFFLALLQWVAPTFLPNAIYHITSPVFRAGQVVTDSFSMIGSYFNSKNVLELENERLTEELASAKEQLLQMAPLQAQLKDLLLVTARTDLTRRIFSAVLLRPPLSPYDVLVLDVGARDGVLIGDRVFSVAGTFIGKITEVFNDFSRVTLLSAPGNQVPVLLGEKNIQATAVGMGGGMYQLLLPREIDIKVGDTVAFAGITPVLVGTVALVEHREVDFLQLVSFQSPVNFTELRYVAVENSVQVKTHESP